MTFKGEIEGLSQDMITGKARITFIAERSEIVLTDAEKLKGKQLRIDAKIYRKSRSLDANAFYWVMVGKLAESLNISTSRVHNMMLRRYGKEAMADGKEIMVTIPDTDEAEKTALESETFHIKPTSRVISDGSANYRVYKLLKGSSEYDTKEMSDLIDGVISECNELGIETMPPAEVERIKKMYEKNQGKE